MKESIRLQKYMAECGVASRRACEEAIAAGRVSVNGQTVMEPGTRVNAETDTVSVDGRPLVREALVYLAINKPMGYLCTCHDPEGRPTVFDLLRPGAHRARRDTRKGRVHVARADRDATLNVPGERLYPVGRLDSDSEGLLVLTNDGAFAHRLMHPRHHVAKVYWAWVNRELTPSEMHGFRMGLDCDGERLRVESIRPRRRMRTGVCYEVTLGEGRNRHIRRMFEAVGIKVLRLRRVAIGRLDLGDLGEGEWRHLEEADRTRLRGELPPRRKGKRNAR